ncbi:MAG TPA: hypothetical protein VHA82_09620 [Ramlibacter sp.]|uniref:hypothetical protein n=1 Tax=Ramlibacter sp. TaxID=1917967 RepID=UPI002C5B0096|nr:hypothetical protein [Ramlibacter sp.]HVZ44058.1 hypothetical protein [Ramlibacter sp.]
MAAALAALTCYFNPFHGNRRLRNYRVFRRLLGVPLVTVEWSRDGRFDLSPEDADLMIRVEGGDLMWQKERLLNLGLARMRREQFAPCVAVLDADTVFAEDAWAERVVEALDSCAVVQCYSRLDYLPEVPLEGCSRSALAAVAAERSLPSRAFALWEGRPLFSMDSDLAQLMAVGMLPPFSGNPGMATAFRLDALPHFEHYENNIVGGGDTVLTAACSGELDALFRYRNFSLPHQADMLAWTKRSLPAPAGLGWAANRILHLWHGLLEDRQYGKRMDILASRGYDPRRHLDRSGVALRFREGCGDLRAAVADYLASRHDA